MEENIMCPVCGKRGNVFIASRNTTGKLTITHEQRHTLAVKPCDFHTNITDEPVSELVELYREHVKRFRQKYNYADGHFYRVCRNMVEWYWMYREWRLLNALLDTQSESPRWLTSQISALENNLMI